MDLTLSTITHQHREIIELVRTHKYGRSLVLTPNEPTPKRWIEGEPARWVQAAPTFTQVKPVANWGWLRRQISKTRYSSGGLVHPLVGTAFTVRCWGYSQADRTLGSRMPIPTENFDPIFIARLDDGRFFADQWASPSVLWESLDRWRNVQGLTIDWQSPVMESIHTCAIGGKDWDDIPNVLDLHRQRKIRERNLGNPHFANAN